MVRNWIKAHSPSGVLNWEGGQPYPEVTGYLIPTLLKYGEDKLARRYADWLLSIQNEDGSFPSVNDQKKRTFDTSACYEGLKAIGEIKAAAKAKKWLQSLYLDSGALPVAMGDKHTEIYTARASGLINSRYGKTYWSFEGDWDDRWGNNPRTHYIAYLLEGLDLLNVDISIPLEASKIALRGDLMPYRVNHWNPDGVRTDVCATCQFAMLYKRYGINADEMLKAVEEDFSKRGIRLSWAAKFYLDAKL